MRTYTGHDYDGQWDKDGPVARYDAARAEATQTPPTANPPTQTTPTIAIHNDIADELVARFGGILRCETCGNQALLTRERISASLHDGWPKCMDLNGAYDHGVMRWWTQTQIDAGLMPEIWLRGDVVLDDTGNMFAFHPRHGWWGLISNQASARADTPPCPPLRLLIRDHKPVT